VVSAVHAIVFVNPSVSERGYLAVQAGIFGVIDRVGRRGQTPFVEICSSSFNSRRTPGPGVWALRKVFKSMNVSADPGSQLLVSGGLLRHKCRNSCPTPSRTTTLARFAGNRIVHRNRCTGPVHKTLLARLIYLAKNYILLPAPTLVEPAEATVAVPFRMHLPVFFPSQLQRQMAMLLQLRVQGGKIREDLFGQSFYHLPLSEQGLLNALLVPAFRSRPEGGCYAKGCTVARTISKRRESRFACAPRPRMTTRFIVSSLPRLWFGATAADC
jgi:hypothetical protein